MRVKLVRKLANRLDGIDVSNYREGDVIELTRYEGELLIAEGWAVPFSESPVREVRERSNSELAVAADGLERRTQEQLRRVRAAMAVKQHEEQERRRVEDRIRDELHDARAKTIDRRDR